MSSRSGPRRLIGPAVASLCAAFGVRAEEFSWQLSGVTSRAEAGDFDRDGWAVDGTYYLNPIDDSTGPYALASFLNPTTRVSATASKTEAEIISDPAAYTLSGAFVLPGDKWYVGAAYSKSKMDDTPFVISSDPKGYGVSAGRYLGANTTLELGLGRSAQKSSFACVPGVPSCIGPTFETETTTDSVDLEVFHVRRFRSLTYSLQGRVSESDFDFEIRPPMTSFGALPSGDGDSPRIYSIAAELFPTHRLGVRVGYSRPDGDFDFEAYNVAATWFIKPRVGVQFTLSRANLDNRPPGQSHPENAGVRFIGRF